MQREKMCVNSEQSFEEREEIFFIPVAYNPIFRPKEKPGEVGGSAATLASVTFSSRFLEI
jgi:hypothetical protein